MAIPFKVFGSGNGSDARNVYKVSFDEALSSYPRYEAWDNQDTFPAVDLGVTPSVTKKVFTGTTGNSSKPMLSLISTTSAAPGSSSWKPASVTAGAANPNRLKGTDSFVQESVIPDGGSNKDITFNICLEAPFDGPVPSVDELSVALQVVYTYTGEAPTPKWYANEGNEGSPTWTELVSGASGIKFCNEDASPNDSATHKLTLPPAGVVDDGSQIVVGGGS